MSITTTPPSFKAAFEVLQRNAETLRSQQEPCIDDLLPIVQESLAAYSTCKARINAVEQALKEALTDSNSDDHMR